MRNLQKSDRGGVYGIVERDSGVATVELGLSLMGCITFKYSTKPYLAEAKNARELSAPIEGAQIVTAKTHNGSIVVAGEATENCMVSATVHSKASTHRIADDLAKKTEINLKRSGSELIIEINKPRTPEGQSVWVDLDVRVPYQLAVRFGSHNGPVTVVNVSRAKVDTHNGRIAFETVLGRVEAESHNGSIRCKKISGPTAIKTHNGSINIREFSNTGG